MTIWQVLIWGGTVLTVVGLVALVWCILTVLRARRGKADDETLRRTMRRVMVVNMAALAASILGLMTVVLGIMLGK
ncbi:hypothetical protein [Paracoccus aminophilus]|uniref:Uncharacterized protein n=1 Tax=Paracoccus aminophilus JCM 7686 TaxID=1367847 RepID=S5Y0F5_PARAH|nr:hypothetical protein [Paracoccus aminophilus]AGT09210.1 hypothetical protein JCM7686_2129 [Paracoccus aminophilus JCM 7686]